MTFFYLFIYYFFCKPKHIALNVSAFKDQCSEIKLACNVWPKWYILAYEIFFEKFTFIYDTCFLLRTMKARRFNLREPGLVKALLNLKGRNITYTSHSLIPLTLPLKMLITRVSAFSFTSSCKAFILREKKKQDKKKHKNKKKQKKLEKL